MLKRNIAILIASGLLGAQANVTIADDGDSNVEILPSQLKYLEERAARVGAETQAGMYGQVPGQATEMDRSAVRESMTESMITEKIKAELAKDEQLRALPIEVDTDRDGVVQLSGYAGSQDEADKAAAIARSVEGVASVRNEIRIEAR